MVAVQKAIQSVSRFKDAIIASRESHAKLYQADLVDFVYFALLRDRRCQKRDYNFKFDRRAKSAHSERPIGGVQYSLQFSCC